MLAINSKRRGQTFSLVHLLEALMAVLVLAMIGIGLMSLLGQINFTQKYFAKDNAYLAESLMGVPNGDVEYAYLWKDKDYSVQFTDSSVIVGRIAKGLLYNYETAPPVSKAHGTSLSTIITPQEKFLPQYYQFSARVDEETKERTITIVHRVALKTCPENSDVKTVSLGRRVPSGLSSTLTGLVVEAVRRERTTLEDGPQVAVVFSVEQETNVAVYSFRSDEAVSRLSCVVARRLGREGINAVEDSSVNAPPEVKGVDAALVIHVRGRPALQQKYQELLVEGLLDYWFSEENIASRDAGKEPENEEGVGGGW